MIDTDRMEEMTRQYLLSLPDNQPGPFELRLSSAGECPRLLDYRLRDGRPAPQPSQAMRMLMGQWMHSMWQDIMAKIFGDGFVNAEQETFVDVDDLKVPGHPDGEIVPFDCVWEFKSVSVGTFKMVADQDHPIPSHYEQGNMYAYSRKRKWILFHYFCRDDGESLFLTVPMSETLALATIEKMRVRRANRVAGQLADRPYNDPNESPCWFCERKDDCYKDFTKEFDSYVRAEFSPNLETGAHESAAMVERAKAERLKNEKLEGVAKKQLADFMHQKKIKSFKIGAFVVDAKIGKNLNTLVAVKTLSLEPKENT